MRDATDGLERNVIAWTLFNATAELMLLSADDRLAAPLLGGDLDTFGDRVGAELELAGGRVQTGFVR